MDQAGPPSPQKQCAVIITTFFHTKPLCSHGHAWLHVRWRPSMSLYSSQSHTLSRVLSRSTVLPRPFSSVPILFFPAASIFVSERIFAYLPSYSCISVAEFRGNASPTPSDSLDSQLSAPTGRQSFCYFAFIIIGTSPAYSSGLFCVQSSKSFWVIVYSQEWENDLKENDTTQRRG